MFFYIHGITVKTKNQVLLYFPSIFSRSVACNFSLVALIHSQFVFRLTCLSVYLNQTPVKLSSSPTFGQCRRPPLYTFNFNFRLPSIFIIIYISRSKPAKPRPGLRSPDFFHFFITFRNDVVRSLLRFIIGLREVLPHDADAEQLNRADEDDHTHGGCPAGDRIAEAQASDNDDDQHDRCHDIAASNLGFEFNVRHQASH